MASATLKIRHWLRAVDCVWVRVSSMPVPSAHMNSAAPSHNQKHHSDRSCFFPHVPRLTFSTWSLTSETCRQQLTLIPLTLLYKQVPLGTLRHCCSRRVRTGDSMPRIYAQYNAAKADAKGSGWSLAELEVLAYDATSGESLIELVTGRSAYEGSNGRR